LVHHSLQFLARRILHEAEILAAAEEFKQSLIALLDGFNPELAKDNNFNRFF